ncbi:signal peptidase I [Edaphobacter paludis]|uniref:Signal peptidase I n=1 Tax=Edaphobacter paludis TaxID=3035702 RepID=A0AAU7D911_9BACT
MTESAIDSNPLHGADAPLSPAPHSHHLHLPHHANEGILPSIQSLLAIMVIAIFIITFCIQPFRIPSGSMEPSLLVGDFLLVNKQITTPGVSDWLFPTPRIHRGEIVVFHYPINPTMHLVKRVIGLPGDRIKLRDGRVYINGQALSEPYAMYLPSAPDGYRDNFPRLQSADPAVDSRWWIKMHRLIDDGELTIPSGDYFVLGDNRNDSEDSRYWGFVPRAAIVGEPILIYFSLQQHSFSQELAFAPLSNAAVLHRHRTSAVDALADFARWGRTLQIVK